MKNVILFGLVGLFSVLTALDAQAGRRCGGRHHRRGGCYNVQPCYNGGCQMNGGAYVDPNVPQGAGGVPVEPVPVTP